MGQGGRQGGRHGGGGGGKRGKRDDDDGQVPLRYRYLVVSLPFRLWRGDVDDGHVPIMCSAPLSVALGLPGLCRQPAPDPIRHVAHTHTHTHTYTHTRENALL